MAGPIFELKPDSMTHFVILIFTLCLDNEYLIDFE